MAKLSQAEVIALREIAYSSSPVAPIVQRAMRSKPALRLLTKLQDKGLIAFDPFGGTAVVTDAGLAHIR